MAQPVAGLNPALLVWARERAGLTIAQVADAMGKGPEVITSWEEGTSAPTYVQLEKLAYTVYRRPIALLFFPEPPSEPDPHQSFRTLPTSRSTTFPRKRGFAFDRRARFSSHWSS
jgi:transcriptional regulator with XRE-family HTH domain